VHSVYPESLAFMRVLGVLQGRLNNFLELIAKLEDSAVEAERAVKDVDRPD